MAHMYVPATAWLALRHYKNITISIRYGFRKESKTTCLFYKRLSKCCWHKHTHCLSHLYRL